MTEFAARLAHIGYAALLTAAQAWRFVLLGGWRDSIR